MAVEINPVHVAAVATTALCWVKALTLEQQGDYDFVTGLFGFALFAAPVLGWGMFYLGRWLA